MEEEGERCRFTTPQSTKYGARHRLGDAPYALEREPKEINKLSIKIEKDACSERGRVKNEAERQAERKHTTTADETNGINNNLKPTSTVEKGAAIKKRRISACSSHIHSYIHRSPRAEIHHICSTVYRCAHTHACPPSFVHSVTHSVSQSVIHSPFRSSNQSTADPGCLVMPALPVAWCLKLSSRGPDTAVPWFLTRPGGVRRDKGMTRPGFGVRHHIFGDTHVHVQVPGPGCRGNGRVPANDTRTARGGVEFFELLS